MPSRSRSRESRSSHGLSGEAAGRLGLAVVIGWLQTWTSDGHNRHHESERTSLLRGIHISRKESANPKARILVWTSFTLIMILTLLIILLFPSSVPAGLADWIGVISPDPMRAAHSIMARAPVIDGHIDLPFLIREKYSNNVSAFDLSDRILGHVDIPRLRAGRVGGFFWSVYVACPSIAEEGDEFLNATWSVRDTMEQIDVARIMIDKYSDTFQLALSSSDIRRAIQDGKIASLLGVEGGHQLGNSIAVLRQYYTLGVRYMTLTHTCHNVFADSCGYLPGKLPLHRGISQFGTLLIKEMNRLGMVVDLSHTSDLTAIQALHLSEAPVIWSHSSARAVHDVPRNVPDEVLNLIGHGPDKKDAVVMVNFAPQFIALEGNATVEAVADHIDHIAQIAGKQHVGLGSDYDGIGSTPVGLEDVSSYPNLIAELYKRGWSNNELSGLTGGNLLRILGGVEEVARRLKQMPPIYDLYPSRTDL